MPYGRRTANFPRNCIIVGTTNDKEFLKDRTGNRRFWPVGLGKQKAKKSVFDNLPAEVDQIWAEAVARWMIGEPLYMSGDVAKVAKEKQENYRETSPKEGVIREFLDKKIPMDWKEKSQAQRKAYFNSEYQVKDKDSLVERDRICAAEVWCECFGGDLRQMRRQDTIEINSILNSIDGWERKDAVRFGPYGRQRGYIRNDNF
jgi:predicted P-loop ATPase